MKKIIIIIVCYGRGCEIKRVTHVFFNLISRNAGNTYFLIFPLFMQDVGYDVPTC